MEGRLFVIDPYYRAMARGSWIVPIHCESRHVFFLCWSKPSIGENGEAVLWFLFSLQLGRTGRQRVKQPRRDPTVCGCSLLTLGQVITLPHHTHQHTYTKKGTCTKISFIQDFAVVANAFISKMTSCVYLPPIAQKAGETCLSTR